MESKAKTSSVVPPVDVELTYNAGRCRVQVTFSTEHCTASATIPADVVARAEAKLQALKDAGDLAVFTVHRKRFAAAWCGLGEMQRTGSGFRKLTMTLAEGAPNLPGFDVQCRAAGGDDGTLVTVSIAAEPAETASWQPEWLALHVSRLLRANGVKRKPSLLQLHGALLRARAGQSVRDVPIKVALRPKRRGAQQLQLMVNEARQEIGLTIFDLDAFTGLDRAKERLRCLAETVDELQRVKRARYRVLKDELLEAVGRARAGPESLGIGMPVTFLVAIDPLPRPAAPERPDCNRRVVTPADTGDAAILAPAPSPLALAVSADKMRVTVADFDANAYDRGDVALTETTLREVLDAAGVRHGASPEHLANVVAAAAARRRLTGLIVAEGTPPVPGSDLYLHVLTRGDRAAAPPDAAVDMRAYRDKKVVKAGEVVAEVRAMTPGRTGVDVTGAVLPPPPPGDLPIKLGDGIRAAGGGRFVATFDGMLVAEGEALALTKLLIHQGDVNMASGDIAFEGPVEVTGDVDTGARIDVGGDLIVHGEIRGGSVRCAGSLKVARGIVTGKSGSLRIRGDVSADFIENSTVVCRGSLRVKRAILQSRIYAGGDVVVEETTGLVSGGVLACGKILQTANLGQRDGAKTEISVGCNHVRERAVAIRRIRLEGMIKQRDTDRKMMREIARKRPAQMSRADKEAKAALQTRVERWSALIEQATGHLKRAEAARVYDREARVFVSGRLAVTCVVKLAGRPIPIKYESISVMITTEEQDGSFLRPYTGSGAAKTPPKPERKSA